MRRDAKGTDLVPILILLKPNPHKRLPPTLPLLLRQKQPSKLDKLHRHLSRLLTIRHARPLHEPIDDR